MAAPAPSRPGFGSTQRGMGPPTLLVPPPRVVAALATWDEVDEDCLPSVSPANELDSRSVGTSTTAASPSTPSSSRAATPGQPMASSPLGLSVPAAAVTGRPPSQGTRTVLASSRTVGARSPHAMSYVMTVLQTLFKLRLTRQAALKVL